MFTERFCVAKYSDRSNNAAEAFNHKLNAIVEEKIEVFLGNETFPMNVLSSLYICNYHWYFDKFQSYGRGKRL